MENTLDTKNKNKNAKSVNPFHSQTTRMKHQQSHASAAEVNGSISKQS